MTTADRAMSGSATVSAPTAADDGAFPFRCELSLAPLIKFWTQLSAYHEFGRGPIPGLVREQAREAPELASVIEDLSVLDEHRGFVDLMMTAMFPPAFWQQEYGAALARSYDRRSFATLLFGVFAAVGHSPNNFVIAAMARSSTMSPTTTTVISGGSKPF